MKIILKQGVWLSEVNDPFLEFVAALWEVAERWGDVPVITSAADGQHMEGSLHYKGLAWDLRTWSLRDPAQEADQLRFRLNEEGHKYDVLFGDKYHRDHIHVEYDPK